MYIQGNSFCFHREYAWHLYLVEILTNFFCIPSIIKKCAWEKPVLDRVGLIIEIFNAHAQTKEAKLQVFHWSCLIHMKSPSLHIHPINVWKIPPAYG